MIKLSERPSKLARARLSSQQCLSSVRCKKRKKLNQLNQLNQVNQLRTRPISDSTCFGPDPFRTEPVSGPTHFGPDPGLARDFGQNLFGTQSISDPTRFGLNPFQTQPLSDPTPSSNFPKFPEIFWPIQHCSDVGVMWVCVLVVLV